MVQRCHRDFLQLPAWLQLEAMRQLEKRLTDVQNTPHNAAEIFAGIIYKLQRDPPSEPPSLLHLNKTLQLHWVASVDSLQLVPRIRP